MTAPLIPGGYRDDAQTHHPWQVPEAAIGSLRALIFPDPGDYPKVFEDVKKLICSKCKAKDFSCGICRLEQAFVAAKKVMDGEMCPTEAVGYTEDLYKHGLEGIRAKYDHTAEVTR